MSTEEKKAEVKPEPKPKEKKEENRFYLAFISSSVDTVSQKLRVEGFATMDKLCKGLHRLLDLNGENLEFSVFEGKYISTEQPVLLRKIKFHMDSMEENVQQIE